MILTHRKIALFLCCLAWLGMANAAFKKPVREPLISQIAPQANTDTTNGSGVNYFNFESNYSHYSQLEAKKMPLDVGSAALQDQLSTWNVVGKALLPMSGNGLDFYAQAGIAQIGSEIAPTNAPTVNKMRLTTMDQSEVKMLPTYGIGASYNVKNVTTRVELDRLHGYAVTPLSSESALAPSDVLSFNFAYHFN